MNGGVSIIILVICIAILIVVLSGCKTIKRDGDGKGDPWRRSACTSEFEAYRSRHQTGRMEEEYYDNSGNKLVVIRHDGFTLLQIMKRKDGTTWVKQPGQCWRCVSSTFLESLRIMIDGSVDSER